LQNGRPALSEHAQVLTREEEVLLITRAQTANALELVADELHGKLNAAPTLDQLACHTGLVRPCAASLVRTGLTPACTDA